jgi:hypothetical protein
MQHQHIIIKQTHLSEKVQPNMAGKVTIAMLSTLFNVYADNVADTLVNAALPALGTRICLQRKNKVSMILENNRLFNHTMFLEWVFDYNIWCVWCYHAALAWQVTMTSCIMIMNVSILAGEVIFTLTIN